MEDIDLFIRKIPLFQTLSETEVVFLAGYITAQEFAPGEIILKQGDHGSSLYLLYHGEASVTVELPGDTPKEIAQLHPGQIVGEVSFLASALITATVRAVKPCICMVITTSVLEMLRTGFPETAFKIERAIALQSVERIAATFKNINHLLSVVEGHLHTDAGHAHHLLNNTASCQTLLSSTLDSERINSFYLSEQLGPNPFSILLPHMSVKNYERGYRLLRTEDDATKLSWIFSGAAMLFNKSGNELSKSIAVSGINDLLLQNFLFHDFQDVAEYVTCENCTMLELSFLAFDSLKITNPSIYYAINQHLHFTVVNSLYIVNREFIRINSEYKSYLKRGA